MRYEIDDGVRITGAFILADLSARILVFITPRPPVVLASEGIMGAHCLPPVQSHLQLKMSRTSAASLLIGSCH